MLNFPVLPRQPGSFPPGPPLYYCLKSCAALCAACIFHAALCMSMPLGFSCCLLCLLLCLAYVTNVTHIAGQHCSLNVALHDNDITFSPSGSRNLVLRNCHLRRFSVEEALACLGSKREFILLMGDSITRYQYLSLVYFLESGNWSHAGRSITNEKEWNSWNHFYEGTNSLLRGRESCDCTRSGLSSVGTVFENRMYRGRTGFTIGYIQVFNDALPPHGHFGFPPFEASHPTRCKPGNCTAKPDWIYPLACGNDRKCINVFDGVVQFLRPTKLFLAEGWSPAAARDECWIREVMTSAIRAAGEVYWKTRTTTASARNSMSPGIYNKTKYHGLHMCVPPSVLYVLSQS